MVFVRSLLFNIYFILMTSLLMLVLLPTLCLPWKWIDWIPSLWASLTFWGLKHLCRISFRVVGPLPQKPCLIASNHQSTFETLVFHHILKKPVFIIKKELLSIPLFGWYLLKFGAIPVNRSRNLTSLRTLAAGVATKLSQGHYVIIFPEGKRVLPGGHEPFKPGIASFYTLLHQSVTPVVVNSGYFWSRRSFIKYPGTITVQFLEPIAPGLPSKVFLAQVEQTIHQHLSIIAPQETPHDLP